MKNFSLVATGAAVIVTGFVACRSIRTMMVAMAPLVTTTGAATATIAARTARARQRQKDNDRDGARRDWPAAPERKRSDNDGSSRPHGLAQPLRAPHR